MGKVCNGRHAPGLIPLTATDVFPGIAGHIIVLIECY